jgi:hypothetical protein
MFSLGALWQIWSAYLARSLHSFGWIPQSSRVDLVDEAVEDWSRGL